MLTRVILAAGVAALAISAPAGAQRADRGGKERAAAQRVERASVQRAERAPRVERTQRAQRVERAPRVERTQRVERAPRVERVQRVERQERVTQRVERAPRVERTQRVQRDERIVQRANRVERQQVRDTSRIDRQAMQIDRQALRDQRRSDRQAMQIDRQALRDQRRLDRQALSAELRAQRLDTVRAFSPVPTTLAVSGATVLPVGQVTQFVGAPLSTVTNIVPLMTLPSSIAYLYPDTPQYYYRYGGGYLYEVDRDTSLIAALIPLLAGGFLPGQYLPNTYMNSYMPASYGFNSFYQDYGDDCYRYGNGVIYEVDCFTGLIEDVIPLYAGGYGVGQMLPTSYSYYNVPLQYRDLYYPTASQSYWYAPGAIYQVDPTTSLITSIASLLSPGFSVGQQLPMGYSMYNVPMQYRSTYYDTPSAWYRYNNGSIYQIDPTTMLVTAIVASILT